MRDITILPTLPFWPLNCSKLFLPMCVEYLRDFFCKQKINLTNLTSQKKYLLLYPNPLPPSLPPSPAFKFLTAPEGWDHIALVGERPPPSTTWAQGQHVGALGSDSHRLPFQNKRLSDTERHTVHSMGLKPPFPPAPIRRLAGARMVSKSSYQGCSLHDALWERSRPSNN